VDDASLYKHIDSELPDSDRARQLILLCAARAPLSMPREGKDPPSKLSEKGAKLLQDLKDDVLHLLAERKIDMNLMATDQPGSPANGSVDIRPNDQNVNNRARTTRFKDEIRMYVHPFFDSAFPDVFDRTIEQRPRMTHGPLSHNFTILIRKQW
jgi:kinetochore protein Mis13/DSN1